LWNTRGYFGTPHRDRKDTVEGYAITGMLVDFILARNLGEEASLVVKLHEIVAVGSCIYDCDYLVIQKQLTVRILAVVWTSINYSSQEKT